MKDKSTSSEQLLGACASRLPKNKVPAELKIVNKLPLTTNGKVDKAACLHLFEAVRN